MAARLSIGQASGRLSTYWTKRLTTAAALAMARFDRHAFSTIDYSCTEILGGEEKGAWGWFLELGRMCILFTEELWVGQYIVTLEYCI